MAAQILELKEHIRRARLKIHCWSFFSGQKRKRLMHEILPLDKCTLGKICIYSYFLSEFCTKTPQINKSISPCSQSCSFCFPMIVNLTLIMAGETAFHGIRDGLKSLNSFLDGLVQPFVHAYGGSFIYIFNSQLHVVFYCMPSLYDK